MKKTSVDYSIVLPVYNEEETIKEIIKRVRKVPYPGKREIIVVDDGSTDNTSKLLLSIPEIRVITNKVNRGKGYSLRCGFEKAKGKIVLIQDADLEYDPRDHLRLIEKLNSDRIDVVYGSRFLEGKHKPRYTLFYFGNIFLSYLTRILFQKEITDMETGYKAFKRKVLNDLDLSAERFDFEPEITCKLIKKGYTIVEVPISYQSRSFAEGKKIGISDGIRAIYVLLKLYFVK